MAISFGVATASGTTSGYGRTGHRLEPQEERERIFCFGFQLRGFKQLFVILPNGNLVITDDLERLE